MFALTTQTHALMNSIAEVSNLLEKFAKADIIDWRFLSEDQLKHPDVVADAKVRFKFTDYIPKIGDFTDAEQIGRGGSCCVYKVRHKPTGAVMAMKVVPRSKFENCNPELIYVDKAAAGMLSDPSIIKTHMCFLAQPNVYCLLMDFQEQRYQALQLAEALNYLTDFSVGLIALQVSVAGAKTYHLAFEYP